jgi:predicted hotdog family 3-hydroxylacyl-ACP dehydratase
MMNGAGVYPHAGELTPHKAPMLLIDRVIEASGTHIRAEAVVRETGLFFQPGRGLPSYVGFEIMAQAVSAFDGWRRRSKQEEPQMAFLLGCRKFRVATDWFAAGDVLEILATSVIDEGEMRSFDCRLLGAGGVELASGVLNVYRPDDPQAFLRSQMDDRRQ